MFGVRVSTGEACVRDRSTNQGNVLKMKMQNKTKISDHKDKLAGKFVVQKSPQGFAVGFWPVQSPT